MADGDLRPEHFPYWFDFVRLTEQSYRDAAGASATAAPGEPRFDHDVVGAKLGLLIGFGAALGAGDRASLQSGVLNDVAGTQCTVLHGMTLEDGSIDRRAWYSTDARATVNALMTNVGRHAVVAVMDGYLPNRAAPDEPRYARARGWRWYLANAIAADGDIVLSDDGDRPLIEQ